MVPHSQICSLLQRYPVKIIVHIRLRGHFAQWSTRLSHQHTRPISSSLIATYASANSNLIKINFQSLTCRNYCPVSLAVRVPSSVTSIRLKQTSAECSSDINNIDKKEFVELYFIKNISFLRVLCRFAKLSTLMFLFAMPASFISSQLSLISAATGTNIALTFACYSILFTTQSFFFSSRIVGKIMMSTDEEVVKFSHLSLFGERRDVFFRPKDIVPPKKERGGGYVAENLCTVRIKGYSKVLIYLPHQGHADTDHECVNLLINGMFSKSGGL
ncbi:transmembrane protein 186 [Plakobranchus ocellatus]|uniref:Transmembrane protein 186 n=1 Tax=Plakobranchus ocellatus TaxID=259542 RepID=A0AAV4BW51_9GAST|nr:transmembrane protein 186 [Plakobranchus ocellatus]